MDELIDEAEQAFIKDYYSVSDDVLAARVRAAPNVVGATVVELSEFMATRVEHEFA